jgi:uncharacterized membrane protein (DUF441 family)
MSYFSHFDANQNPEGQIPTLTLTQKNILLTVAVIFQLIFGALIVPGLNISGQALNWMALLAFAAGMLIPFLARQKQHLVLLYGFFAGGIILGYILSVG